MVNVEKKEVKLGVSVSSPGTYSITAKTLNAFVEGKDAFLKDAELNTFTEITDTLHYNFEVANVLNVRSRFSIIFYSKDGPTIRASFSVRVSPNPVKKIVYIEYKGLDEKEPTTIKVTCPNGNVIKTIDAGKIQTGSSSLSVQAWNVGRYEIELINGDNRQVQSITKQ